MIPNRHPADELAELRRKIRALRLRETALREKMLREADARIGSEVEVEVQRKTARVFCKEKLPGYILSDPSFYETREQLRVVARKIGQSPVQSAPVQAPDTKIDQKLPHRGIRPGDPVTMPPEQMVFDRFDGSGSWGAERFEVIDREPMFASTRAAVM